MRVWVLGEDTPDLCARIATSVVCHCNLSFCLRAIVCFFLFASQEPCVDRAIYYCGILACSPMYLVRESIMH